MMSSNVKSFPYENLLFITTHHHCRTKLFKIDFSIQIAIGIISLILFIAWIIKKDVFSLLVMTEEEEKTMNDAQRFTSIARGLYYKRYVPNWISFLHQVQVFLVNQ